MDIIEHGTARPTAVKLALIFLVLDAVAANIVGMFYGPWNMSMYYYIFGFGLVLDFVPLWFAFRRKNWARWFVAIYTVFCVCDAPFLWHRYHLTYSTFQTVWFWSSDILDIIAVIMLFYPSSNRWFGRRTNAT
jgi:hypothetical protein